MNHLKPSCPTTEKVHKGVDLSAEGTSVLLYFFLNLYQPRDRNKQSRAERILKVGTETELSLKSIKTWMLHTTERMLPVQTTRSGCLSEVMRYANDCVISPLGYPCIETKPINMFNLSDD